MGRGSDMGNISYLLTSVDGKTVELECLDSYQIFLKDFDIERNQFLDWGVNATIFPNVEKVEKEWIELKRRILNNQKVYIRGYGRDAHGTQLYKDLYKELFNNACVEKDPTNNTQPHKIIERLTGLKRNKDIFNYQVSHIWGHTKNIFLFEAPWNVCYTPKIMDPFTGHETKGIWPAEYQRRFLSKAEEMYKPFIEDYNQLLIDLEVENHMKKYFATLYEKYSEKQVAQFVKDASEELTMIK